MAHWARSGAQVPSVTVEPMSNDPLSIVNASGFAFQLSLTELVRASAHKHQWDVTTTEHGWQDGATPRFIDFVLSRSWVRLVVECKRPQSANWVFLVPDPKRRRRAEPSASFRALYLRNHDTKDGTVGVCGLTNMHQWPVSWESAHCALLGHAKGERPMLDRLAAELVRSAEAVAAQSWGLDSLRQVRGYNAPVPVVSGYLPVIVTTAQLRVCRFDPEVVPLDTGHLPADGAEFEVVPYVRYRKSFDAPTIAHGDQRHDIGELEAAAQRSVVVVNALHFIDWLTQFEIRIVPYR